MDDATTSVSDDELAELAALADGSLPAGRRAAVEARVAASPDLQALLERQRQSVAATGALADDPVPASLQAAVERLRAPRAGRRRPPWPFARVGMAAAVVAAVAAVAAIALTGGPGGPTVAEAARFAAQTSGGPPPRPLGDGARLAVDVEGVVFPDLRPYGWRAVAVRRGRVDGRRATSVAYASDGRRIAYAVVAGDGLSRPSGGDSTTIDGVVFQTLRVAGRTTVTWRRLGRTCVLVGDAPRDELLTVASWRGNGTLRY